MAKKKRVTIDDLAMMVQRGFHETSENINGFRKDTNKKFENVDKRIESIDKRFENVENEIGDVKNKVNQIDRRLFSIEEDIAEIKIKQYGDLLKRVSFIERKLGIASTK